MANKLKNITSRRKFIAWGSSLVGGVVLTGIFQSIYSGSLFKTKFAEKTSGKNKRRVKDKGAWNYEYLVLNKKTKVIHFPNKKIFKYYKEIDEEHLRVIGFDKWKSELTAGNHFHKDTSGIILEKLALRQFLTGVDSRSLNAVVGILSFAFVKDYVRQNEFNWRIYDLLLTAIVLDESVASKNKQSVFFSVTSEVNYKAMRVPRKNSWLKSHTDFESKVTYLRKNSIIVSNKLAERAKKFWSV